MRMKRITAMLAVATLAGYIPALVAQENSDALQRDSNTADQNIIAPKPLAETATPVTAAPAQAYIQPAEKLLSEMKVYPTF